MVKKFALPLFLFLFFLITIPSFYLISSQSITITEKKVVYELPYPGILPDHPLYFLKRGRDGILAFANRKPLKKAEFYLHLSDKKLNAAVSLAKKGKNTLAAETLFKGEEEAVKVPPLLKTAKEQGSGATPQYLEKVRVSNAKHREVMEQLLKTIPQGDQKKIEEALKLNEKVKTAIPKL